MMLQMSMISKLKIWSIKNNDKIVRIILMLISLVLNAILYNLFLLPLNLVTGGTPGIATITHYVYGINPAIMLFFLSFACVIVSFLYLRRKPGIVNCFGVQLIIKVSSGLRVAKDDDLPQLENPPIPII